MPMMSKPGVCGPGGMLFSQARLHSNLLSIAPKERYWNQFKNKEMAKQQEEEML